jgi:hypothetical protein
MVWSSHHVCSGCPGINRQTWMCSCMSCPLSQIRSMWRFYMCYLSPQSLSTFLAMMLALDLLERWHSVLDVFDRTRTDDILRYRIGMVVAISWNGCRHVCSWRILHDNSSPCYVIIPDSTLLTPRSQWEEDGDKSWTRICRLIPGLISRPTLLAEQICEWRWRRAPV